MRMGLAAQLKTAIRGAGVLIEDVSIGEDANKATWKVRPAHLQSAAQSIIDAFNSADPAHEQAELTGTITAEIDNGRLVKAILWCLLKQLFPSDTDTQTRNKLNGPVRMQVINAYVARPWIT